MKGFVNNIEKIAEDNQNFRQVLYTGQNCQLVVMSLNPGEEIGMEVHQLDQFLRVESGSGQAILDEVVHEITSGFGIVVPAGANHNLVNTGTAPMKIYTVYSPPNHLDGTIHTTKTDAVNDDEEHFDGKTTE